MSTATSARTVGDNEFPVLLRLPDLNAPLWMPPPAAVAATVTPAAPTVATPPAPSSMIAATNVAELPAMPQLWTSQLESSTSATFSAPAPSLATSAINVSAPTVTPAAAEATTSTTVTSAPRTERAARATRPATGQWTLIRQLATGGVLVGGLALTYFMIMGSGDDGTPAHIPTAATPLEPPVIVTPTVEVAKADAPKADVQTNLKPVEVAGDITAPGPPPDFSRDFNASPALPPHISVAEAPKREVTAPPVGNTPPQGAAPITLPPMREDVGQFKGRIGPDVSAAAPAPSYPTTNPATFLYRPDNGAPESEAARTARLQGTIAPPPRR